LLVEQDEKDAEVLSLQRAEMETLEKERIALGLSDEEARALESRLAEMGDPRKQQQERLAVAARKGQLEAALVIEQESLADVSGRVKALTAALTPFEPLDDQIEEQRSIAATSAEQYEQYMRHREESAQVETRQEAVSKTLSELEKSTNEREVIECQHTETAASYDGDRHAGLRAECEEANREVAREHTRLLNLQSRLSEAEEELAHLRKQEEMLRGRQIQRDEIAEVERAVKFIRETINQAGPAVTESLLRNISQGANDIYEEIMDDHTAELRWDRDYEVLVQRGSETRSFVQLSGGEQMSAALAVRLALLKEMSEVDFAFFDEPTQNMDGDRRSNLADQIRQVRGFEQLIVISHDDTFEHHTDNLIRLKKEFEETQVE
jgi:exonuclease SbcC